MENQNNDNRATKLTAELKEKWLTALRGGQYEQGIGQLRCDGKYCCLGVLAEVAGIRHNGFDCVNDGHAIGYKPLTEMLGDGIDDHLIALNDTEKRSFVEIADYIEENL